MRLLDDRQFEGHLQVHTGEAESENELLLQQTKQSPVLLFREYCQTKLAATVHVSHSTQISLNENRF